MLMLLAAALTASAQSLPVSGVAVARGQATIRIVSAVRLRVGAERSEDGHAVERSTIQAEDGRRQPAMLVQFQ